MDILSGIIAPLISITAIGVLYYSNCKKERRIQELEKLLMHKRLVESVRGIWEKEEFLR